jgi:hypothetical protein
MLDSAKEQKYPTISKVDPEGERDEIKYNLLRANNFNWLAANFMDKAEKQILKLTYDPSALSFIHEQLLDCFDKIGDIELFLSKKKGTLQHRSFSVHLMYVINTIRHNNINLNHLLAHLIKMSFQTGDILDVEDINVKWALKIFSNELKEIFDACLKGSKQIDAPPRLIERCDEVTGEKCLVRVNAFAEQYDFDKIDPKEVMTSLIAFLGQLTKSKHSNSAKAIHNLFYVLRQVVKSYVVDGGMNEEQIGAVIRVVLRDGLKLSDEKLGTKICVTNSSEAHKWGIYTELAFIGKIAEIAMSHEHEIFDMRYVEWLYQEYYQRSHNALVELELKQLGVPKRKLSNGYGLIQQMKGLSLNKVRVPEDSVEILRNRRLEEEEQGKENEKKKEKKVKLDDSSDSVAESRKKLLERTNSFDIRTPTMLSHSPDRIIRHQAPIVPGFSMVRSPRAPLPVNPRGNEIYPRKRSTTQVVHSSTANGNAIEEAAKQKKIVKVRSLTNSKGN